MLWSPQMSSSLGWGKSSKRDRKEQILSSTGSLTVSSPLEYPVKKYLYELFPIYTITVLTIAFVMKVTIRSWNKLMKNIEILVFVKNTKARPVHCTLSLIFMLRFELGLHFQPNISSTWCSLFNHHETSKSNLLYYNSHISKLQSKTRSSIKN